MATIPTRAPGWRPDAPVRHGPPPAPPEASGLLALLDAARAEEAAWRRWGPVLHAGLVSAGASPPAAPARRAPALPLWAGRWAAPLGRPLAERP